jgi:2-methylcitrate dehydratase PrpD
LARIDTDVSPVMRQLSAYVAGAVAKPLPPAVTERAKLHLLDTLAAMLSGSRLLPGMRAASYVKGLGGQREAGVIGTRIVTAAHSAALANGMSGHADETDDTHPPSRSHPGTCVVPAALAMCEARGLGGKALLQAVVLGYDVCARTLAALASKPMISSTYGHIFGAAAASAALCGLDAGRVRHVFTYAGQQASGLYTRLRDPLHVEKAFAVGGMPAQNGVLSARMVAAGFSGVDDVLSGEHNFLSTHAPQGDPQQMVRGLGREFEILRAAIKCWSAGGPIQGPLHVLHDLIREHGILARDVERVVVRMPDKELKIVTDRASPDISVQHLLALMLVDGAITFASAHDHARVKDPRVRAVRRRIETVGDPALTDPLRRWRCVMQITLKDGRVLDHRTMAARGTAENPVTRPEAEAKAYDLMVPVISRRRAQALVAAVWDIDRLADVRALRRLYSA